MLIVDGDYPMAFGALDLNRDLTVSTVEARALQDEEPHSLNPNTGIMATLPEMRRGGIAAALVKVAARIKRPGSLLPGYTSGENAYAVAQGQLAYYNILAKRGEVALLRTRGECTAHFSRWEAVDAVGGDASSLPVGFLLGMEGADPILWPDQVVDWYADGLRVISLTHYGPSSYAHGTGTPGGLTPLAKPLLSTMEQLGMILDLTHISDDGFWQALDLFNGPVLASHQNCRVLVPGERQFSDDQLIAVIKRGGVIGASMDTWMLYPDTPHDWAKKGNPDRRAVFPREAVTLAHVADHIDHVCQLAGNADHAAIGGDTDGQGGSEGAPADVDTVADYQRLAGILAGRGYGDESVNKIMWANWFRFYQRWLPD